MFEEDPFCLCILQQNLGEKIWCIMYPLVYTLIFFIRWVLAVCGTDPLINLGELLHVHRLL